MSSTSVISGTGFMKCMPRTSDGRVVAAPIVVIEMDDVLEVRMTSGRVMAVSYTHLRAPETVLALVCRLLLAKNTHISRDYHGYHRCTQHVRA